MMKRIDDTWSRLLTCYNSDNMLQTLNIKISGKVQGVFYRQSTKEKATQLGIKGFVMNMPDGCVVIIATGTKQQMENLLSWCWQGPPQADVSDVITIELPLQQFDQFVIRRL